MKVEEVFKQKTKKGHVSREWEESERGNDPLIIYWMKRKNEESVCKTKES